MTARAVFRPGSVQLNGIKQAPRPRGFALAQLLNVGGVACLLTMGRRRWIGMGAGMLFGTNAAYARAPNDRWSYRVAAGYFNSDALSRPGTRPSARTRTLAPHYVCCNRYREESSEVVHGDRAKHAACQY